MMTGQIEEPISFSFQADSIHSGSISFGRFAHEPLLWERRSAFSHSRIQEEVARCLKHRIVTEKKAYFEAQFKKKALLRQCSADEKTRKQFGTSEKGDPDMRSQKDDTDVAQGNKNDASSESSIYTGYREDFDYEQEAQVNVHFDESSDGSNDFDKAMDYDIEGKEILISERVKLPSLDGEVANAKVDGGTVTPSDTQTVIDCTYSRCSSAEHDVEVEKNVDAYTCYVEEECKAIDLCAGSPKAEKEPDAVSIHGDVCPQILVVIEPSGKKSNGKVTCTQRDSLCEAAKVSSCNIKRLKNPSVMETKTLKQSKLSSSPAKKMARSTNPEHMLTKPTNYLSKTMSGRNSASKELWVAKVPKSPATTMIKDAPNTHQSPDRTKRVIPSKDSDFKTCTASSRLRIDVRADKSKDIHTRVVQISHIRKAEINRTHVKTQDKTSDEIKKVREGLSIKSKPTQSLHNKDERLEYKKKDAIDSRPQTNPSILRTKVVARSSTNIKAEKGPPNSSSKVSTINRYSAKEPTSTTTRTRAVSLLVNKSAHPSSMRNAGTTKLMAGHDKEAKLKNQTVPLKIEATKGSGTTGVSQSTSEKIKKCTIRKVTEKPRMHDMCRAAARVC